jgi:phytanoyl-CoA hydroxylase
MTDAKPQFKETIPASDIERYAADYERDGCVRVPGLLPADELPGLRRALERYIREVLPKLPAGDFVMEAGGRAPRNLWRMEQHDPFFRALPARPDLERLVGRLVHGEPVLAAVESFCKPARIGSAVPPHQDNAYFCQKPPDMLTVWIAIDAATEANGPITYVRGSHRRGLLPHRASGVSGNSLGLAEPPKITPADRFVGLLEPGDSLIHHCETIHFSAPNPSASPRWGLLLVMRGAHTGTDPALQAAYDKARPKT